MKLFGYWRSSATYRIRIILALKNLDYDYTPVNLLKQEQADADYKKRNPQSLVPTFETDGGANLTQSLAIAEYLEERFPEPPLLPDDVTARARARAIAATLACEGQPFMNIGVQTYLKNQADFDSDQLSAWLNRFTGGAMRAAEALIEDGPGPYALGETLSLADVFIVPQVFGASRFGVDLKDCPKLVAIAERCNELDAFQKAHPKNQPDAEG